MWFDKRNRLEPLPWQIKIPDETKKAFHQWVDTCNKFAQIAALLVAGAWAWISFKQTVAPGLETKVGIDSELHWAEVRPAANADNQDRVCEASLQVTVNNPGKGPFDIRHATVKAWLVPISVPADSNHPSTFDREKLADDQAFYNDDKTFLELSGKNSLDQWTGNSLTNGLADHYSEGVKNSASVDLFLKYVPRTLLVFFVRLYGDRPSSYWPFFTSRNDAGNYTYQLDQVCGAPWDHHLKSSDSEKTDVTPKSK